MGAAHRTEMQWCPQALQGRNKKLWASNRRPKKTVYGININLKGNNN